MVFKMIWWIYFLLGNLYGAYTMISAETSEPGDGACFILYVIFVIVSLIFLIKNIIKVCSPEYKREKADKDRRELDKINQELQEELNKIAFERECEEKRKKLQNNKTSVATYSKTNNSESLGLLKGVGKLILIVGGFFTYITIGVIAKLTSGYMKKK